MVIISLSNPTYVLTQTEAGNDSGAVCGRRALVWSPSTWTITSMTCRSAANSHQSGSCSRDPRAPSSYFSLQPPEAGSALASPLFTYSSLAKLVFACGKNRTEGLVAMEQRQNAVFCNLEIWTIFWNLRIWPTFLQTFRSNVLLWWFSFICHWLFQTTGLWGIWRATSSMITVIAASSYWGRITVLHLEKLSHLPSLQIDLRPLLWMQLTRQSH